ncbi:ureidoglycolate lyase [Acinetobacter sp. NIPH 2699]|uniref:ureidoglycolate lyase n=1 Tax=Acinetobacter sp. NIPH 2699 TaxID=2923433 RepID=UPI001F4AA06F|nr:ureidoglycolate lyase [Acinetobacter sp. NIPH 2699]MCH7337192.1 ureidoglycolate lyase [Acinetobacter sp. NIPH 2699]
MHEKNIQIQPLTQENFAPFGDVIEKSGKDFIPINQGLTERYHALSLAQVSGENVAVAMSIFHNLFATAIPFQIEMLERHPYGSQSFIPLQQQQFVIVVALPLDETQPDEQQIYAFLSNGKQGITYHQGVWHHPLITLEAESDFLVVDRIGGGQNCDVYPLSQPHWVVDL